MLRVVGVGQREIVDAEEQRGSIEQVDGIDVLQLAQECCSTSVKRSRLERVSVSVGSRQRALLSVSEGRGARAQKRTRKGMRKRTKGKRSRWTSPRLWRAGTGCLVEQFQASPSVAPVPHVDAPGWLLL
jgi:hypothetical protein